MRYSSVLSLYASSLKSSYSAVVDELAGSDVVVVAVCSLSAAGAVLILA